MPVNFTTTAEVVKSEVKSKVIIKTETVSLPTDGENSLTKFNCWTFFSQKPKMTLDLMLFFVYDDRKLNIFGYGTKTCYLKILRHWL